MNEQRLIEDLTAHPVPQACHVALVKRHDRRMQLPEWRRPCGTLASDTAEAERIRLREVLFDLAGRAALSAAELRDGVLEHWGDATPEDVGAQLRELVRVGALVRSAGGYVRCEP